MTLHRIAAAVAFRPRRPDPGVGPRPARQRADEHAPAGAHRPLVVLLRLLAYVGAFLMLGALLAFPAYSWLRGAADVEFDSVLRRIVTLTGLLLLPVYVGSADGRSVRAAFGFGCSRRTFVRDFLTGFGLGFSLAAPLLLAFLVLGIRTVAAPVGTPSDVVAMLTYALLASVIIGVFEEAYFRGALYAPLARLSVWAAVPIVSVAYAAAHFIGAPVEDDVDWLSGVTSIARSDLRLDAFLALVAAGVLLGAMRCRYGHVGLGAGFHAGWVWLMKISQEYGDVNPSSDLGFLAGPYGGTMGYLGLAWIVLLGAIWFFSARYRARGRSSARRIDSYARK